MTGILSGLRAKSADYTTSGAQTALLTAGETERLAVYDIIISSASSVVVTVLMGSTTVIKATVNGVQHFPLSAPILGAKGEDLIISLGGAVNTSVSATGRLI